MKLYLVRHGETDFNVKGIFYGWTDCDINGHGLEQAEGLKDFFKDISIDIIYSSDLKRAVHTAEIIQDQRKVPLYRRENFRELYYGDWENVEGSYVKKHHREELRKWYQNWETNSIPGGEPFSEFYERVTVGLEYIIANHPEETVVLVAHSGTISAILCYLTGAGTEAFWKFPVYQGCYNSVVLSGKRIVIERINCPVE